MARKSTKSKPPGSHPGNPLPDSRAEKRDRGGHDRDVQVGATAITTVPTPPVEGVTLRDLAARLRDLPFPDEDFADDLEAVQAAQALIGPSRWDS